jgi:hypothetical protein
MIRDLISALGSFGNAVVFYGLVTGRLRWVNRRKGRP